MDHNEKRSHSVPVGTFTDHGTVGAVGTTETAGLSATDASEEEREDTLPFFTLDVPRPARQRIRTLLGVPALSGQQLSEVVAKRGAEPSADTAHTSTDAASATDSGGFAAVELSEISDAAPSVSDSQPGAEMISSAIAEVLEVLEEPQAESLGIVALPDTGSDEDEQVHGGADDHAGHAAPELPLTTTTGALTGSLASVSTASFPAVIDVAPARRTGPSEPQPSAAAEPIVLQEVSPLEALAAEIERPSESVSMPPEQPDRTPEPVAREGRSPSVPPPLLSSLAPREVARQSQQSAASRADSADRLGLAAVAAVMLLAALAWWATSGTFVRTDYSAVTAPPPAEAAVRPKKPAADAPKAPAQVAAPAEGMAKAAPTAEPAVPAAPALAAAEPPPEAAPQAAKLKPAAAAAVRARKPRAAETAAQAPAASAPAVSDPNVPEAPSRSEVLSRLEAVRPSVRACAAGRSGVADLDITIAHTGMVMHVLVGGDFAGTTEGSCIARAVRGARFPSFKQERFRLLFPYAI